MGPLKLVPCYKDYIWGGQKLKTQYNKKTELKIVAESWELSAHKDGSSVISDAAEKADKPLVGMLFSEFMRKYENSSGTRAGGKEFPVLIKLIDAKNDLSLQVHPDDEFASKYENSFGKTELWHILEAEEGSYLYVGFKRDLEKEELRELIQSGGITNVLNKIFVKKGDTILIEAGTLHAINRGIVLAEIQQNSNLTYRVYDYGRLGSDGSPRQLHIDKALAVTNTRKYDGRGFSAASSGTAGTSLLCECPYFKVSRVRLEGSLPVQGTDETFAAILITCGALEIVSQNGVITAEKGDCIYIPAGESDYTLKGAAELLLVTY